MTVTLLLIGGLVGLWVGGTAGILLGCFLGRKWWLRCEHLEHELAVVRVELAKADQANDELGESVDRAFRLGLREGQLFRADREAEGL